MAVIRILERGSLTVAKEMLLPETLSVTLEERSGSATFTVPAASIGWTTVGDWAKIERGPGSGILWRVRTIDRDEVAGTITIALEHIIQSLKDELVAKEVGPADMGGSSETVSCRTAIRYALSWQELWTLGSFEFGGSAGFEFNNDSVFDAIETVCSTLEGAEWSYDFSRLPLGLHIRPRETGTGCEMRRRRNITTMKTSISTQGMYTRFYPIGKNDLRLSGSGYVSRNEGLYGIISKTETDSSLDTEAKLRAWAEERLSKHAEPIVTVTISGLEMSEATGEPLDHIRIGKVCRVPLPEVGTTIRERVTRMQWPDALREPERITVTLANTPEDLASIIKSEKASSSRSGRAGAKKAGEDHAWFEDTEDHVAMVAEAVIGTDKDGVNWSRVASVVVDGEGIHQRVTKAQGDIVAQEARIDVNEERILQEVTDRTNEAGVLRSEIQQTATAIRAEVANEIEGVSGQIEVTARRVSMVVGVRNGREYVKAAEIATAINEAGEGEAIIDAKHVYIGNQDSETVINGKATVADLNAAKARILTLETDSLMTDQLSAAISALASVSAKKLWIYDSPGEGSTSVNVASTALRTASITRSGDTYYLHLYAIDGTECVSTRDNALSFSRATTLSGQWSGGEFTVNASPQGDSIRAALFDVRSSDITWNDHWAGFYVYANLDGGETRYNTGKYLWVDASGEYEVKHSQFSRVSGPTSYDSNAGYSTAGKLNLGSLSKASLNAPGYLAVRFSVHGHTEEAYIVVNT